MRGLVAGLGVMLVDEGGADGEAGGGSPSSSAKLQLVGALRRGKCSGAVSRQVRAERVLGSPNLLHYTLTPPNLCPESLCQV